MKRLLAIAFILAATSAYGETILYTGTAPLPDIGSSTNNRIDIDNGVGTELELIADIPTCADCPPGEPCAKSVSDGCNTCTYQVWCVKERWFRGNTSGCTTVYCYQEIPLTGNPFLGGVK